MYSLSSCYLMEKKKKKNLVMGFSKPSSLVVWASPNLQVNLSHSFFFYSELRVNHESWQVNQVRQISRVNSQMFLAEIHINHYSIQKCI